MADATGREHALRNGRSATVSPPRPPARGEGQGIADWVFENLKRDVIRGRLAPETVLVEGVLAAQFGVSRGPAREALHRMRGNGLVRSVPRVGYIVTTMSLRDYNEVFQLRLALEPLSTRLATERLAAGQVGCERLEMSIADVDDFFGQGGDMSPSRLAQINHDFHLELARMSGNVRLEHAIDGLLDELQRVMHLLAASGGTLAAMRDDHAVLLQKMRQGDPARAGELMLTQLTRAQELMSGLAMGSDLHIGAAQRR